jgi:ABC-type transport system involved in multi-copper enzyme maturation permease subunit
MINRHIIRMELRRSLVGLIAWTATVGLSLYLIIILWPMVKDMYAQIPESMKDIMDTFGGIPTTVIEYFATEGGMMMQLFGAIFAAMLGYNTISREERDHTTDSIYTLPVSRLSFYFHKLLAVFLQVVIFSVGIALFNILGFITVGSLDSIGKFLAFMALNTLTFLMIASLGFTLGSIMKGNIQLIALIIPIPLYIVSVISSLTDNKILEKLRYVTPFTFSDPVAFFKLDFKFEYISLILFTVISAASIFLSSFYFTRKEFNA